MVTVGVSVDVKDVFMVVVVVLLSVSLWQTLVHVFIA